MNSSGVPITGVSACFFYRTLLVENQKSVQLAFTRFESVILLFASIVLKQKLLFNWRMQKVKRKYRKRTFLL